MTNKISRKLSIILSIIFMTNIASCASYESSPAISFFNISDDYVYKVRGNWSGYYVLGNSQLIPGDSPSLNLVISNASDFFGPVHLEWTNAKGELIKKDFTFTKDQLPNTKHHNFDHVYIFLTQDAMELFTRGQREKDSPEIQERKVKARQLSREYNAVCREKPITSLAEIWGSIGGDECKKFMPIYQKSNMAKLTRYRNLYDKDEAQRLENIRKYHEQKKLEQNQ